MIQKLFYRVASRDEKIKKEMRPKVIRKQSTGGMYFDTSATVNGQPLLLPEESCLAEDEHATLQVECERGGFNFFGKNAVVYNTKAKAYLTNLRLIFVPTPSENQTYTSSSICIQAIQEPHIDSYDYGAATAFLGFDIGLSHGASATHPATCKTIGDFFEVPHDAPLNLHEYRRCHITCTFTKSSRARMFLKGIKLLLADGLSCPTMQCRFIGYEDLPVYCAHDPEPPPFEISPCEKLPLY
jgi:hypothetical protein